MKLRKKYKMTFKNANCYLSVQILQNNVVCENQNLMLTLSYSWIGIEFVDSQIEGRDLNQLSLNLVGQFDVKCPLRFLQIEEDISHPQFKPRHL